VVVVVVAAAVVVMVAISAEISVCEVQDIDPPVNKPL